MYDCVCLLLVFDVIGGVAYFIIMVLSLKSKDIRLNICFESMVIGVAIKM
jgi:hypothetical protein